MSDFSAPRRNRGERNERVAGGVSTGRGVPGGVMAQLSAAESATAMAGPTAARSRGKVP